MQIKKLRELDCSFLSGYGFKSQDFVDEGIPLIKIGNIQNKRVEGNSSVNHYPIELLTEKTSNCLLENGDVLIAMTGQGSVGRVGKMLLTKHEKALMNQRVGKFICDEVNLNREYLFYILTTELYQDYLFSAGTGSGQPNLSPDVILETEIPAPSFPEQKAIASVLSSLDDKMDLLHRQNKTLEAMAETLFRQWFVEEADDSWEVKNLGEYIKVKHGFAFKGEFISTEANNQILVTPGNFKIGGGYKLIQKKYYIGTDYPIDYIFSNEDLIVTMTDLSIAGDTLGTPALIPHHDNKQVLYLHNQRVGKIKFNKPFSKYYLYFLMKTDNYHWEILGGASGTSIRHTSPSAIEAFEFQVPPFKRLIDFDQIVKSKITKIHVNYLQIQTLEKLRDTLLPKLMSGEVRVKMEKENV